jgi:hypothetical protein
MYVPFLIRKQLLISLLHIYMHIPHSHTVPNACQQGTHTCIFNIFLRSILKMGMTQDAACPNFNEIFLDSIHKSLWKSELLCVQQTFVLDKGVKKFGEWFFPTKQRCLGAASFKCVSLINYLFAHWYNFWCDMFETGLVFGVSGSN